jgi:hypothetical protein
MKREPFQAPVLLKRMQNILKLTREQMRAMVEDGRKAVGFDTCDKCGARLEVGDFPFCPHGQAVSAVIGDDVPGGFWVENGFSEPKFFTSKKAHRDALAKEGKEIAAKWVGPTDKHLKRWDAPSAKTLNDARILLERGMQTRQDRKAELAAALAEFPITVRTLNPEDVGR